MKKLILVLVFLWLSVLNSFATSDISIRTNIEKEKYGEISINMQRVEEISYNELGIKTVYYQDVIATEYFTNSEFSKQWIFINLMSFINPNFKKEGIESKIRIRLSEQWTDWAEGKLMVGLSYKLKFKSLYLNCSYDTNMAETYAAKSKFGVILFPYKRVILVPSWTYKAYNNQEPKSQLFIEIKVKL